MVDVQETIRERLKKGENLNAIKEDLIKQGQPEKEVQEAVKVFDWKAERRDYLESGKEKNDQMLLNSASSKLELKRVVFVIVGLIAIVVILAVFKFDNIGIITAIAVAAITLAAYTVFHGQGMQ